MRISDWSSDVCSSDLPLDGYTICLSFHHAMCDATSVSILHQYLNDYILGVPSCSGMQLDFLDRCVNEDERLPLVHSRQLHYWERLLSSSKDERSEEHTSELQSLMRLSLALSCLKKKIKKPIHQ